MKGGCLFKSDNGNLFFDINTGKNKKRKITREKSKSSKISFYI